jgi:hypothetical protein
LMNDWHQAGGASDGGDVRFMRVQFTM